MLNVMLKQKKPGVIKRALGYIKGAFWGYDTSYRAASLTSKTMRRWLPLLGSANKDYSESEQKTLLARCRDAYRNQAIARAALNFMKYNVTGTGLKLQAKVDEDILGIDENTAREIERVLEREFSTWAESYECDFYRKENFYGIQQLVLLSWLVSGDVFVNTIMLQRVGSPYMLKLQVLESEMICNPNFSSDTERIRRGIELDRYGVPVAYHILEHHPYDDMNFYKPKWRRIPIYGRFTGRKRCLQICEQERPGQLRGVSYLAPILESLKQLDRYTEAELAAAVISSLFTVFIKTEGPYTLPSARELTQTEQDKGEIVLDPGLVIDLNPGEDITVADPTRPNSQYNEFVTAIEAQIAAALGVSRECITMLFNNSYSAARASLLMSWRAVNYYRSILSRLLCQPVYDLFIDELILSGKLNNIVPQWIIDNYYDYTIRAALTKATWVGPQMPVIDELKAVKSAEGRINIGISTIQREAEQITGMDWLDLQRQRRREVEIRKKWGIESDDTIESSNLKSTEGDMQDVEFASEREDSSYR